MAISTRLTPAVAQPIHLPARNGAEALIQTLTTHGIEYLFLNPGTDTAPVQEAIVALGRDGQPVPTIVSCLYENVALAAAHGYFAVTGRPQAVLVHVDAGTQNLGGNMHDAQRGRGGVIVFAGRTPYTVDGRAPGSRDRAIQWFQDQLDQPGIVRGYVKWYHELARTDTLSQLVVRGAQIAGSAPAGPVYMTLGREVLMAPMDGVDVPPPARFRPVVSPAPDPHALDELADWLADAEAPLAIAGVSGQHPASVAPLVALAELLGMAVNDKSGPLNIPLTHDAWLWDHRRALAEADVVLLLDADVPWIPKEVEPPAHARVAQIDMDPTKDQFALWGFAVDLPLQADTAKALPLLLAAVERRATPERRARWAARRAQLGADGAQRAATTRERVAALARQQPLAPEWVAAALGEALPADAILVEEATTSQEVLRRHARRTRPGTLFHPVGPGLGWAAGAAVGMKLAAPDQPVVAVTGDGSFIFSSPIAALYAAQQARAPYLHVVMNNSGYNASKNPVLSLFPEGASARADAFPGVRFENPPDYAQIAQACHAYGERVTDPAEVAPALQRGLAAVAQGQAAVLDMIIKPI
jgi:acetolactate synthase I/II/III large subunit